MIRGTVDRERLEAATRRFQDDIDERFEWTRRNWITAAQRDREVASFRGLMGTPQALLDLLISI
jgi:hypothetical protein